MRRFLVISAGAVTLALAATAGAAPREIDVGDDFFAPKRPPARDFAPGPSFRWTNGGGTSREHNIRQNKKLFFSGPLTAGPINFAIRASAGSYPYYCELHRSDGMTGVVKVRPIEVPDSVSGAIHVRWANSNTNTGSRFDVRYKVDGRKWKTWKDDTTAFHAFFGRNDQPVNYAPSRHNYKLKVRSERRNVKKRSRFSPVLKIG